ncbi:MAG: fibronectin type III domain-containing protein [Verrucomicrobia bacterium]|nr:fibronectin type III domain-containing protein [Verrucomicrobiota bacterium]
MPTNLRAATTQRTSISIAWSFNGASQGFRVQRSSDGGATWTQIVQTPGSATAVQDSGLTPGTKYLYRVQALNDDGPTAWSSALSKTTLQ